MRKRLLWIILFCCPGLGLSESNLTPAQPLETNPLAQQFTPGQRNTNTQLYVTQFTDPGATQQTNNANTPSLTSLSNWIQNPSQLLSNQVLNRYGVGLQVGF
jgi:hypothetical protein